MIAGAVENLTKDPLKLGIGVAVVLGAVYLVGRKIADDAIAAGGAVVDTAAGIATGNNRATETARTSAYQGKGILGTLGAVFDRLSGGGLSSVGEKIGGTLADTHDSVAGWFNK